MKLTAEQKAFVFAKARSLNVQHAISLGTIVQVTYGKRPSLEEGEALSRELAERLEGEAGR